MNYYHNNDDNQEATVLQFPINSSIA